MKLLQDMTEPELRELMTAMATQIVAVSAVTGCEKPQFVLLLFNDAKVSQYVANVNRADCVLALREAADRLERREDVPR